MYLAACVAVEKVALPYDKPYRYLIPPTLADGASGKSVCSGSRVTVPFGRGNQKRTGLVLAVEEVPNRDKLKPVQGLLDPYPLLDKEGLLLLRYLKEQTFCTWFDALRLLIPAGIGIAYRTVYTMGCEPCRPISPLQEELVSYVRTRRSPVEEERLCGQFSIHREEPQLLGLLEWGILLKSEMHRQRILDEKVCMVRLQEDWPAQPLTKKQQQVVAFLEENGAASLKELCYYTSVTRAVADTLQKKEVVEYYDSVQLRNPYNGAEAGPDEPSPLSPAQKAACDSLVQLASTDKPVPALLYGVTGSGKTQVFLKLIEHILSKRRKVIVMVPEISLTSQTVRSFHRRFGSRVAVLHSGLSLGERMDEWKRIKTGGADIVVGTRSAVFAPLDDIGLIVVDEEQEATYKSEKSPRFHAREVARMRCEYHGGLLLLASATPSVETYFRAQQGKYTLITLEERFGDATLPDVYVVDMKDPENHSSNPSLSQRLLEELRYNLEHGEQSILLLNRRGYSTVVKCTDCGTVADCPHCSVALTYHTANSSLICHTCGYSQPKVNCCAHCGSDLIRYTGSGTQKLEEELAALFPTARILRVDMDTTMSKFSHEKLFAAFSRQEYDIMIGTQMVAKGLNFPQVTLVGVVCADQSLYNGDFRSFERSFSLLTQVVGRSGRGEAKGRALIQTYTPENPIIQLAAEQDYPAFYKQEIISRKLHLYPPYCTMAGVGFVGLDVREVYRWSRAYLQKFREMAKDSYPDLPIRLLGPAPFDILKVSGKYRYKLVIKCRNSPGTRALLADMAAWFYGECKNVNLFVDMYYDRI